MNMVKTSCISHKCEYGKDIKRFASPCISHIIFVQEAQTNLLTDENILAI